MDRRDVSARALETELEVKQEEYENFLLENDRKMAMGSVEADKLHETAQNMLRQINILKDLVIFAWQEEYEKAAA